MSLSNLKIAIVHWLVNDVGGINSWTENFVRGCRALGCQVSTFYSTHQNRLNCSPTEKVNRGRYHLLPAYHLPYTDKEVAKSVQVLNRYDLVVFAHPSPHPVKATEDLKWSRGWQKLYTDVTTAKVSVFHDRHWDRTNTWMAEVSACPDYVHAAQHHFVGSVRKFAELSNVPWGWSTFPLVVPKVLPLSQAKVRQFTWATQWLAIKNHRFLVPRLLELRVPVKTYGGGQVYHKLVPEMVKTYREDWHAGKPAVYNKASPHAYYGHVEYARLLKEMAESWFSMDLSIQGMTNMTHWEPMTVGTISVMERRVAEDKYCEIPKTCCKVFDLDTVVEDLNEISATPIKELQLIQQNAFDLVQRSECSSIAKKILCQAGMV